LQYDSYGSCFFYSLHWLISFIPETPRLPSHILIVTSPLSMSLLRLQTMSARGTLLLSTSP